MPYITSDALSNALSDLKGTADHLLKIWFTLKQMGMTNERSVVIDTSSSHDALVRLFAYGNPTGDFFIPFAHTDRFMTMKADADRSIIQTNLNRWAVSGSVVTVDPTAYLEIKAQSDSSLIIRPGRNYPLGLGYGKNGFALDENARVSIPLIAFGVWYYRQDNIERTDNLLEYFQTALHRDLNLSIAEQELIFTTAAPSFWEVSFQDRPLTDTEIYHIVQNSLQAKVDKQTVIHENYQQYITKVNSMTTTIQGPKWLNYDPLAQLKHLIENGSKAILLYGPPRTGKTRAIDVFYPRDGKERETIQIHSGWGYDELIVGLRPTDQSGWTYRYGPFVQALKAGITCIVLEEINRTEFSQAIGEVFSLIEPAYRGEQYQIRLRNGEQLCIPENVLIICTMNTLDRTTEEIDDAILGRMDAVEFPPRVENLQEMLANIGVHEATSQKLRLLFAFIQQYYPLGHGYFADLRPDSNLLSYYLAKIRPVLQKHMKDYRDQELATIDEKVDELFGQ